MTEPCLLQANATKMQARLYRLRRSVDLAADVVNKVLAIGFALYLHTVASKLVWYQLALLSIYAL